MEKNKEFICPVCGSSEGYYTKIQGFQYYNRFGVESGYSDADSESKSIFCVVCHRRFRRE